MEMCSTIVYVLLAVIAVLPGGVSGEYYGKLIASFPTKNHDVSGTVYAVDDTRLYVKDFTYDGAAPDAFFWFGTSGSVSGTGNIIPNEKGSTEKLKAYNKQDLLLTLPPPHKVSGIQWLSIWCREVGADFGSFTFPANFVAPALRVLNGISGTRGHGTTSGSLTVLDSRTIRIADFSYDGSAPDTFFILGKGNTVRWNEGSGIKMSDEKGSFEKLKRGYQSETIDILAPEGVNIADFDWFSVYCVRASENFGSTNIPNDLNVPPAESEITGGMEYFGLLIGSLKTYMHEVSGMVFVVDYNTLFIKNFNYDGGAPDSYFYYGISGVPSGSPSGQIPDENGLTAKLVKYDKQNIVLTMPPSHNVTDIRWLSVWCLQAVANMGDLYFPSDVVPPKPKTIPSLVTTNKHGVSGGPITLVDSRTIIIENFNYDGGAPDTFFLLGKGSVKYSVSSSVKVPDENGKTEKIKGYNQTTIQLQAPPGVNIANYDWFSVYCLQAAENFAHFDIPSTLFIPPSVLELRSSGQSRLANCMQLLEDELNVHWEITGADITIELEGKLAGDDAYMAFGLSGDKTSNKMIGADVIVAYYNSIEPVAVDYYLSQRAQCSLGRGACPDTKNDVMMVSGSRTAGITKIRFKRKLNTGDTTGDQVITPSEEVAVVWALGRLSSDNLKLALKHNKHSAEITTVQFGRSPTRTCLPLGGGDNGNVLPAWKELAISGADTKEFNFKIGQSGGTRGYLGITKNQGWGIAYYVNDLLIPRLTLKVGEEYTFNIETGDTTSNTAAYHPVYITNEEAGGYVTKSESDRASVTVYAGLDEEGKPLETAVGRLCEYQHKTVDQSNSKDNFQDFFKTMELHCVDGKMGSFKWTPTKEGIYYYQCYQHRYLGWKIEVLDNFIMDNFTTSSVDDSTRSSVGDSTTSSVDDFASSSPLLGSSCGLLALLLFFISLF